ncbi:DUF6343 family protein [Streptomyces sp. NPDC003697]
MRTGSEPRTARSPLRARFWLCVWGMPWAIFGAVFFALLGQPGWAAAFAVLAVVVAVDMAVVVRHMRQGAHYQPGPDVPPYQPPRPPPR